MNSFLITFENIFLLLYYVIYCTISQYQINIRKYRRGIQKLDNPEKLVTQDEEKQNKNTTEYVMKYPGNTMRTV